MLSEFINDRRDQLIALTRVKVAKRLTAAQTEQVIAGGARLFLEQLVEKLEPPLLTGRIEHGATVHGAALLALGYTVSQVVHDYGEVCQAITELASDTDTAITSEEFHILNLCVDNAIAEAVTEYSRLRDLSSAALLDDSEPELPFTD